MTEYTIEFFRTTHEFMVNDGKGNYVAHVKLWKDKHDDFEYFILRNNEIVVSGFCDTSQEAMEEIADWVEKDSNPNIIVYPDPEIMEKIDNG